MTASPGPPPKESSIEDLRWECSRLGKRCAAQGEKIEALTASVAELMGVQSRYMALLHNATDAIIVFNPDGTTQAFNTAAEKLFGCPEIDVLDKQLSHLIPCPDTYHENVPRYVMDFCREEHKPGTSHYIKGRRSNGNTVHLEPSISEIREQAPDLFDDPGGSGDDPGEIVMWLCVLRDKTVELIVKGNLDRHRDLLTQTVESLQKSNQAKEEFVTNMSHEIRTPMTAILGFLELMGTQSDATGLDHEHLEIVQRNGKHLLQSLNGILNLSKIGAGTLDVEFSRIATLEFFDPVFKNAASHARNQGLSFSVKFDGLIPRKMTSDPERLKQALNYVLDNAARFTETGGIQVCVSLDLGNSDDPMLQIDVQDTGIGIASGEQEKVFEPFCQVDYSLSRKFDGTGLGLTIGRGIASSLGGELVLVSSQAGRGSHFRIRVATGRVSAENLVEGRTLDVQSTPSTTTPAKDLTLNYKILLVEDGPDNQRLISFLLRKAGAEVAVADNGRIAVEAVESSVADGESFDLILMDMQMPEMDGYTATGIIKESGFVGPIIALTAHAMAGDRKKCLDAGCDEYATKPIDRTALFELIQRCVESIPGS